MIYTITANPSIDYVLSLDKLNLGEVNRTETSYMFAGGKGINVSRILGNLRLDSVAWGFIGGSTGEFIKKTLTKAAIETQFTNIKEDTRTNVKIKAQQETEINCAGPTITHNELEDFMSNFAMLNSGDIVVASGSVPPSLGKEFYPEIIKAVADHHAEFVIDTTGQALLDILPSHPLLVKPNREELSEMFNVKLDQMSDVIHYGKELLKMGAQHVIVSMGGDGAVMITPDHVYQSIPIKITIKNSVGAGDSMVAGFVGEYHAKKNSLDAFKLGVACGSATAASEDLAQASLIKEMLAKAEINEI
ncbi:1-phosphofructokinase [Xylocopilactobacillus apicola]|uniref:Tagatose-6-phosphate kinase n=1 Tax=Xylocopilactobacillus apicola TaxID=2932184 RepID=A0AAU9DDN0_9LACO|nr:1-phosphofructokinase [Xylocopilactobacillus apicola]BDR58937.1 tagatose-6-phosphate kinase [Xylocopilactobacillus apicola]